MSGSWRESHHLGSLTSLSSAKSAIRLQNREYNMAIYSLGNLIPAPYFSALSIKSDSGIGGQSSGLSKFSKLDFATRRIWCSESQLEKKEAAKEVSTASSDKTQGGATSTKSSKTRSLGSLFKASEMQNYCEREHFLLFRCFESGLIECNQFPEAGSLL